MPKILLALPDLDKTITRVVGYDIIRHVMKETDIDEKTTSIYFPGTENTTYQPGSSIGANSLENELKPDTNGQLTVEVSEEPDNTFMNSTNVYTPENLFTFFDPSLGISIRPSYSVTNLDIDVQYRTRDKNTAYRWRDLIRQKISARRMTYLHTLSYSYALPVQFWIILEKLYQTQEAVAGYGRTWEEYLAEYLTDYATVSVGLDGKNPVRMIRETQARLLGWFDFEGGPEHGGRDSVGDTWTIAFKYHLQYNRPNTALMDYPIIVHNQLIDQRIRPEHRLVLPEDTLQRYPLSIKAARKFESDTFQINLERKDGPRIPKFDEWVPKFSPPNCLPMMQMAVLIDPADPTLLVSFKGELDTYVIDPDVLAWMVDEAPYMTTSFASVFQLSLYRNDVHFSDGALTVDSDLNVRYVGTPNLREQHHLVLYLNRDLGRLKLAARRRAQQHCKAFTKVMQVLYKAFAHLNPDEVCLDGDLIAGTDMDEITTITNRLLTPNTGDNLEYGFYMLEYLSIVASPKTLAA